MRTLLLTLTVCLFVLPAQAKYSGGTGEPNDPYQIATAADLIALGETPEDYDKHFILTADIDLDPNLPGRKVFDKAVIAPDTELVSSVFTGTHFTGVFDGSGHVISRLTIRGVKCVGLFGSLGYTARVSNLRLEAVEVAGTGLHVGGLVGFNDLGSIAMCSSTGAVSGTSEVGGLVGDNSGSIATSYSAGAVRGASDVGGLVGWNNGSIATSYSSGAVSGGRAQVGGLVGYNNGSVATSYSSGTVSGTAEVGGLVGRGTWYRVSNCLWDMQTSTQSGSAGGAGLTTGEMMDPHLLSLNGFANDPNWVVDAGRDYPRLAWEGTVGHTIPQPHFDCLEGQGTPNRPYRIDAPGELILLGRWSFFWDRHFVLAADIDLDPSLPGGQASLQAVIPVFMGVFDGGGHTISHLTIMGGGYLGLFGYLGSGAEVKNLGVVDVRVAGSGRYVAGLVGWNTGTVSSCYSTGVVSGTGEVGGLVGDNNWGAILTDSYSTCTVKGNTSVGGLVGYNEGGIGQCYSAGAVDGTEAGGLVGVNWHPAVGNGMSLPHPPVYVDDCMWDIQTSGQAESDGGTGKTTAQMQTAGTFVEAGWDFVGETANGTEDIWRIAEGRGYPRLIWEFREGIHLAFLPDPQDGAIDVTGSPILRWSTGVQALLHDVYFGENRDVVASATTESESIYRARQAVDATAYDPGILGFGRTYQWRIDEVNEADPNSPWKGSVWSFTTADFLVASIVDDFESYTDEEGSLIYETWIDGWGPDTDTPGNGTGSTVGNENPPVAERAIAHGGKQSMPMDYDNTSEPWYSEAERTWVTQQDWTIEGADTLTLYFRGEEGNSSEPLYVGIEDSAGRVAAAVYPDAGAVLATEWQKWHIDLGDVRAAGGGRGGGQEDGDRRRRPQ